MTTENRITSGPVLKPFLSFIIPIILTGMLQTLYGIADNIVVGRFSGDPDALKAVGIPTVEVHLSDINSREEFRRHSFVSLVAKKTIAGLGFEGYKQALEYFV